MIRICCPAVAILLTQTAIAVEIEDIKRTGPAPGEYQLTVRPYFEIPLVSLEVAPYSADGSSDESKTGAYQPHVQPDIGIAVGIEGLELSASVPLPSSKEERLAKGVTRYSDYKGRLYRKYVAIEVGMQQYKGFYQEVSDDKEREQLTEEERTETDLDLYPQRSDLAKSETYGNIFLIPLGNPKAGGTGVRGHWSPVIGLGYSNVTLSTDAALIPSTPEATFGADEHFRYGRFETWLLSAGALGLIQNERWRAFGILAFGRGGQRSYLRYLDQRSQRLWHNAGRFGMRFGIEHKLDSYAMGIFMQLDNTELKLADSIVNSSTGTIVLSVSKTFSPFFDAGENDVVF